VAGRLGERQGDRLVYEATDVWVTDSDGAGVLRLTSAEDAGSPLFTLDGDAVVLTRAPPLRRETPDGPPLTTGALWRVPLDGSEPSVLVEPTRDHVDRAGAFSPDGRLLVFTRCGPLPLVLRFPEESRCAVYVVGTDGTGLRKLTDRAFHPDWSRDGEWIVFATDRGGLLAYTRRDANDFATELVVSNGDGSCPEPIGSRDGWYASPAWWPGPATDDTPRDC
jgi:dipeptidyl aminopeptidase/acylaminoacyl peptidase